MSETADDSDILCYCEWLTRETILAAMPYVRNLKESVTEERLKEILEKHGKVDKVKRIKDYAFVHFEERQPAIEVKRINLLF